MNRRNFLGTLIGLTAGGCIGRHLRPTQPPSPSLRIAFFTDIHADPTGEIPELLDRAARAIRNVGADLVIGGGDFITEGYSSCPNTLAPRWELYQHFQQALGAKVFPAIGNHDLVAVRPLPGSCEQSADPRSAYCSFFQLDRTYYSFSALGVHVIVLDSIAIVDSDLLYWGQVSDEQLRWLEQELTRVEPTTPIILVTHVPLLTSLFQATAGATSQAPRNRVVVNNVEVLSRFARHNLFLVLQGHLHIQERLTWKNTTFLNGGAICGGWWHGDWHGTPPGFGVITIANGEIQWEYQTY